MSRALIGGVLATSAFWFSAGLAPADPSRVEGGVPCTGYETQPYCSSGILCYTWFSKWNSTTVETDKNVTASSSYTFCANSNTCNSATAFPANAGCDPTE